MVGDVQMALVVGAEILRPVVHHRSIRIPLDVCNVGPLREQAVDDAEDVILYSRIRQVKHKLCASSSGDGLTAGSLYDPFGMFFVKFGDGIRHLWLYPDSEFHSRLTCIAKQSVDTLGQFPDIDFPVAEGTVVGQSGIFGAEPAIIHHKEFTSHRLDVAHHLCHTFLVDVEIDTFPRVEQNHAFGIAVAELVATCPAVEILACTVRSSCGICDSRAGCGEGFAPVEVVLRIVGRWACHVVVVVGVVGVDDDAVVSAVEECGGNDVPLVFASRTVECKEHFVAACAGIACAVLVLYEQGAGLQRMFRQLCLCRPRTGEMCAVYIVAVDGENGVGVLREGDGTALVVADDGPIFHHVHISVGEIVEFNVDGVEGVGKEYGEFLPLSWLTVGRGIADATAFPAVDEHLCGEVAIGMAHGQAGLVLHVCGSVCGVEREMAPIGIGGNTEVGRVGGGERRSVIDEHGLGTLGEFYYETGGRSAELHLFGSS